MGKVVHDITGYRRLRHDPAAQALCEDLAARAATAAQSAATVRGAVYESVPDSLTYRGGAAVHPANYKGRLDNARNNTLLSAVTSVGGPR